MSDTQKVSISIKLDARQADNTITLEGIFNECGLQELYHSERILDGRGFPAMTGHLTTHERQTLGDTQKVNVHDYHSLRIDI